MRSALQFQQIGRVAKSAVRIVVLTCVLLCIASGGMGPSTAFAQQSQNISDLSLQSKILGDTLDSIEKRATRAGVSEDELSNLRLQLERFQTTILQTALTFQPQITELDQQLERLGPVPPKDQIEPETITLQRQRLAKTRAGASLAVKDAEIVSVRARQLENRVVLLQRQLFTRALFKVQPVSLQMFGEMKRNLTDTANELITVFGGWFVVLWRVKFGWLIAALVLSGAVAVTIGVVARKRVLPIYGRTDVDEQPPYTARLMAAVWTAFVPAAAVSLALVLVYLIFDYFELFRFRIDDIVLEIFAVTAAAVFAYFLIRAVLAPNWPEWRLLEISDHAAKRLSLLSLALAGVYGADYFVNQLYELLAMPFALTVMGSLVVTLMIALILTAMIRTQLVEVSGVDEPIDYRGWRPSLVWLLRGLILLMVAASLLGYVSFGRFIASQVVVSGTLLITMYVGFLTVRSFTGSDAFRSTRLGKRLSARHGLAEVALDQTALLINLGLNAAILFIGAPILLLQWGFTWLDIQSWMSSAIAGFNFGGIHFSPSGIVLGIGVFVLGIALTRIVRSWFDAKLLSRTRLDSGVKDSVKTGLGYLGYILAALIAVSYAGLNLANLALVAGALSLGIGFGLQNIVNNFVSGIIMLIERPIKIGDIISFSGQQGVVHQINVRATEVETFDRETLIIPNADLINSAVGNWMHKDQTRRLIIGVGVAYGSDVKRVREILMELATGDERVSTNPPPFVYFCDFGASSLDFQVRMVLRDIMDTIVVESEMRFRILEAFDAEGIEIPFPQTDVHLHSVTSKN